MSIQAVKHIEVLFIALRTDARHNGMLHLGPDKYADDEIANLTVNTFATPFAASFRQLRPLLSESPSATAARAKVGLSLKTRWDETSTVTLLKMVTAAGTQKASD